MYLNLMITKKKKFKIKQPLIGVITVQINIKIRTLCFKVLHSIKQILQF